jgi:diaminohydroxyphosphoribosylaminopyrimidine deaminase/5-amino-6-(5-phosphoribosylamino)uracil reductase
VDAVDQQLMRRALQLAERGWGHVQPNPLVGAVLTRDGSVIAEGWHAACGGPHAEAVALAAAGEAARGATLYVTLEPCTHTGRTPPCTDAILAAGVKRVVIAARDPNPGAGGGAARLRAAGIEVLDGIETSAARRLNAPFFHWHEHGRPWLALKLALSLDGAIGYERGPRLLITGDVARSAANRLRAGFDAVLVGANTALRDDPLLTVRAGSVRVPPTRVVLDGTARLPPGARLLHTLETAPTIVVTGSAAPAARVAGIVKVGAEVLEVSSGQGGIDLAEVLAELGRRELHSVLAEGGARVARSLLEADLVERLYFFLAPRILGPGALRVFENWPSATASAWQLIRQERHGDDTEIVLDRDRSRP